MTTNFNKILLIVIAVLVLGLVLVWFLVKPNSAPQQIIDPNVSVRDRLKGQPVEVVSGKIVEIGDGKIILDVPEVLGVGIPENADLRVRAVIVSPSETAITTRLAKDEETLLRELRQYRPDAGVPPPSPYREKSIKISELSVGDFVFVRGAVGTDIAQLKEIAAVSIVRSQ